MQEDNEYRDDNIAEGAADDELEDRMEELAF